MCSIVGYIGHRQSCSLVMDGLSRLEYRGYDSAGFSCIDSRTHHLASAKAAGRLSSLTSLLQQEPIDGSSGIGHTRWATHGVASQVNAHPHFDCHKKLSVVHNGIIENYHTLKAELEAEGHQFVSETDTEVLAHLFERALATHGSCKKAVLEVVSLIKGAYAFIIIMEEHPDVLIGVRKSSPLCVGFGDGELFVASDVIAFADKTDKVAFLPEQTYALIGKDQVAVYDFAGNPVELSVQTLDSSWTATDKSGHEHYMLKEIYEQKNAIYKTVIAAPALDESVWMRSVHTVGDHQLQAIPSFASLKRIKIIGCGTSWHAGRIGEFFFEKFAGIPTTAALASELRFRTFFPEVDTLYIAVSQSGETADTLELIRFLEARGCVVVSLTNVASSTMVRETAGYFLTHAGPEMAVASTKAFTTQIAALYLLAQRVAYEQGKITAEQYEAQRDALLVAAELLDNGLSQYRQQIFEVMAPFYASFEAFIFLGRHITYPFALEAALKLKEIAYVFAQAYPAGELKHGPLALIDEKTPVCIFSHPDPVMYQKILSSAQEIKARKGRILAFTFEEQFELQNLSEHVIVLPCMTPELSVIAMTGVMQLLMYAIAKERGCDIDRPRNLAKSVTVE